MNISLTQGDFMAKKGEPSSVKVHGYHEPKKSKSHMKKVKSAEKHMKDIAYARKSGKPMTGYKGLPKIVKVK